MSHDELEILLKVILAMCMGGLIGIERELAHKPAGIRTHMFVAGAATLVVSIGSVIIDQFASNHGNVSSDPIRIMEAVIVGVSFIGAGTVLKSSKGKSVYFLTTAASILFAAGIGITVAVEMYWLAFGLTILVILINGMFGDIEHRFIHGGKKDDD